MSRIRNRFLLCTSILLSAAQFAGAQPAKIHISAPSKSLSWFPIHLARENSFYRDMEEIRAEFKLDTPPDPSKAFDWSFVQR